MMHSAPLISAPLHRRAVLAGGAALALSSAAPAQNAPVALRPLPRQPAGVPWPTRQWPRGAFGAGVDGETIGQQVEGAIAGRFPALGQTRAVVIVQGGRMVLERYGEGFDGDVRQVGWSMTKSVTHALTGIAVADKTITLDEPMGHPLWAQDDPRSQIAFRHALTMTDGLRWREIGSRSTVDNDAARLLFGPGRLDVSAWAAGRPREHAPGSFWRYSTGSSHLVAAALQRRIGFYGRLDIGGRQKFFDFMQTRLFRPIGMESAAPEFDLRGTFYGGSLLWASPQDWARFGLLYLRDGVWDGARILPEGWVDFARTKSPAANVDAYGASWWISPRGAGQHPYSDSLFPDGPFDSFQAQGFSGQITALFPSRDLIIVRMGLKDDVDWKVLGAWMAPIAKAFPEIA
jgi:CubicO group peptidase (beta-lactamase class C family)